MNLKRADEKSLTTLMHAENTHFETRRRRKRLKLRSCLPYFIVVDKGERLHRFCLSDRWPVWKGETLLGAPGQQHEQVEGADLIGGVVGCDAGVHN